MSKVPKLDPLVAEILSKVQPTPMVANRLSDQEKIDKIAGHFREIMLTLGLDLEDDSLNQTPQRVAKMYVREVFSGLNPRFFPPLTSIENKLGYNERRMREGMLEYSGLTEIPDTVSFKE